MPIYRYECPHCSVACDAWRKVDDRDDAPLHCSTPMERRIMPTAVKVFTPYMTVAAEKEDGQRHLIRTQAEHEAFLRRNDYVEVGNDPQMVPKSEEEIAHIQRRHEEDARAAPVFSEEDLIREGWIAEDLLPEGDNGQHIATIH